MVIKIIRDSIKKNPRAGERETIVYGNEHINFKAAKMPDGLEDGKNCFINVFHNDGSVEGLLLNRDTAEKLIKSKQPVEIEFNRDRDTIHHSPIRKYVFEYENPKTVCSHCHALIPVNDIYEDYDDDDNYCEQCPVCGEYNTFEQREYENINDIIKSLTL